MQASVLFSLAVSTDFTVAAGREKKKKLGACALRRSSKGPVTSGGAGGAGEHREVQKIEQAERRRSSSLSNTVMRKNGARVDHLTGVGG